MSLELKPVELGFHRPFDREVEEKLELSNPNSDPIAFKVKTTAPKQYCVRPNSGRIEAGQTMQVSVLLQAMKEEPPLDAKCRDKFLVQSVAVPADQEVLNVQSIWSNIESMSKSSIQEKKIRVNFLPPAGSTSTPAKQTSTNHTDTASPVTASTPAQYSSASKSESKATDGAAAAAAVGTAAGVASTSVPQSSEELKAQLAEAQAQISKLSKQVQEQSGLRQRKTDSSGRGVETTARNLAQQAAPSGVQVPIVAVLCLLSFLLAYFMF